MSHHKEKHCKHHERKSKKSSDNNLVEDISTGKKR
jgi:hypothetical protein